MISDNRRFKTYHLCGYILNCLSVIFKKESIEMIETILKSLINIITLSLASAFLNIAVTSASMENTLETGSRLLAVRNIDCKTIYDRYDIIVFHYPLDERQIYIKRIIGLPGEHIEIINGEIFINHNTSPLPEKYRKEIRNTDNSHYVFDVPKNSYLVLGDNRNHSVDSRYWCDLAIESGITKDLKTAEDMCYVKTEQIIAKAFLKYYPSTKFLYP